MNLEKLFNPQSVAIVGASAEEGKIGHVMAKNILSLGYQGKVFLVNPKYDELLGQKCYLNLGEINEPVDLAILAIPGKFVNQEVKNNAQKIKNYVIISSGFSEIGEEGRKQEEELNKIAQENNLNILGPNCLGFLVPSLKLNASFAGGMPRSGNVAFISQSGALAVAMMDIFEKEEIGFSHVVSVGNKMQLGETKLLEYLATHEEVKVIAMYLEGIDNGAEFIKIAQKISSQKPIVVIKAGKTDKSQKAISSHTGALAGESDVASAVLEKTGIIEATTLEEFLNIIHLSSSLSAEPIKKNKMVVVTNAGGAGVLATDAFQNKEIQLAELNDKIKHKLKSFLPLESSVENPIDLLGDAKEDRYKKTLDVFKKNVEIGGILCLLTSQEQTPVTKIAAKMVQFKNKYKIPIITSFIGGERVKKGINKLKSNGIPNFNFPEAAVNALNKYNKWSLYENKSGGNQPQLDIHRSMETILSAKAEGRQALHFTEAKEIFKSYALNVPETWLVNEQNNFSNVSFPVVLKIDSDKVLHKTDQKGLRLNISSTAELEQAISEMRKNFPGERLIIQSMAPKGTELILGIKRDLIFGPVVVYGLGGIYTEVLKMVDFLVPPFGLEEVEKALIKSRLKFLFTEIRGQQAYNIKELAEIIWKLGYLASSIPEIKEFDINPLIIYNNGNKATSVDIKIII